MRPSLYQGQKGFTLVELMIVVAIIGILAAVAMPQYQNYILRTKFKEVILIAEAYKVAVVLCMTELGTNVGCTRGRHGIPAMQKSKYVGEVSVSNGNITIYPSTELNTNSDYTIAADTRGAVTIWSNASSGCLEAHPKSDAGVAVPILCEPM